MGNCVTDFASEALIRQGILTDEAFIGAVFHLSKSKQCPLPDFNLGLINGGNGILSTFI
jgi:hypothetical protein